MQIHRIIGWVCKHALVVCVLVHLIPATCNISRIRQINRIPSVLSSITPRNKVCGLQSLGFVTNHYRFDKNSYNQLKYVSYHNVDDVLKQGNYVKVNYEGLEPLYMKKPDPEARVTRVVIPDKKSTVASGDYLSSRLRSVRESLGKVTKQDLVKVSKKAGLFGLWYAGTVFYNMEHRKTLSMLPLPRTVATLQMLTAVPFMAYPWLTGKEKMPEINVQNYPKEKVDVRMDGVLGAVKKSLKNSVNCVKAYVSAYKSVLLQSSCVSAMNLLASTTMATGGLGFVHLMRAVEPLVTSALSYLFEGVKLSTAGYASLVPVAAGVAYATYSNFDFEPVPFLSHLTSSLLSCLRRVESKSFYKQNLDKVGKNLTPRNMFSTVGLLSSMMLAPLALLERKQWENAYMNLMKRVRGSNMDFLKHLLLSGVSYALVSQLSYLAMSDFSPISRALTNSLKGVLSALTNSFVFDYKLSKQELLGSAVAIAGTVLYALVKN